MKKGIIETRADKFAEELVHTVELIPENIERTKQLLKLCYMTGAEETQRWYSFEDIVPEYKVTVNVRDIHNKEYSFIFTEKSHLDLIVDIFELEKWKPITVK